MPETSPGAAQPKLAKTSLPPFFNKSQQRKQRF
jgi:hypothetical protein